MLEHQGCPRRKVKQALCHNHLTPRKELLYKLLKSMNLFYKLKEESREAEFRGDWSLRSAPQAGTAPLKRL
jgi:hypothetical protein